MRNIIAIFISFILLTHVASALDDNTFFVNHKPNREEINYSLQITPEFQSHFLNALKTGEIVKVSHSVKIRPVNQWFGWMAEKRYSKFYKYNLIKDQFYIGVKESKLKPVLSKKEVLKDVKTLKNAPFLPKNVLKHLNAYEIDFTIAINQIDDSSSVIEKLLIFKGNSLDERLHSAVHYIYD